VSGETISERDAAAVGPWAAAGRAAGGLTQELVAQPVWSDELVAASGMPVVDVPFVTVGGGMGSFVTVDMLRIAGVPANRLASLGASETPWATYAYLARNSQIPPGERLRSDAQSCPDNLWGFPSYAIREAWQARGLAARLDPLWNVLTEPVLRDYFTPRAGQVFAGIAREAARINYAGSQARGQVRMTRRRSAGGYFTILTTQAGSATRRTAYRSRYVHVAVGYPGLRFLPDLQEYRAEHPKDVARVVNAYEPHEHVYDALCRRPGTVLVRGSGVVASRVLQRLIDDRDRQGARTSIVHLFRHYVAGPQGSSPWMRRPGADGWAYQGFNWPKSSWGGQLKVRLERTEGEERARLLDVMGGTNTPRRKLWRRQLSRGRREGFYRVVVGEVDRVVRGEDGRLVSRVKTRDGLVELGADFIVDCTGLEADITEHRYLDDLLRFSGVGRNVKGRLDVDREFRLRGTESGDGVMYASGSATLGGYYSGVDSFLGLQYAALAIADDLARRGFCHRIGPGRSLAQWLRWMTGRPPDRS
jgi:hypothetical protein